MLLAFFLFPYLNVATLEYGKYILISRPRQDYSARWVAYASVAWLDGTNWQFQLVTEMDRLFDSEQEAHDFGFATAREWVNKLR